MYRIQTLLRQTSGNDLLSTMYFDTTDYDAATAVSTVNGLWVALSELTSTDLSWQVLANPEIILASTGGLVSVATAAGSTVGAGTGEGNPLPFATQGLLKWQTAGIVNNRIVRGRTFIPALTEDANTSGVPTGTTVTILATAASDFLEAADGHFGIWSRPITGAGARAGSYHPVTASSAWPQFAVLRSRRD